MDLLGALEGPGMGMEGTEVLFPLPKFCVHKGGSGHLPFEFLKWLAAWNPLFQEVVMVAFLGLL